VIDLLDYLTAKRTINTAFERAKANVATWEPRPYVEVIRVRNDQPRIYGDDLARRRRHAE
jgi:hypothetical protein